MDENKYYTEPDEDDEDEIDILKLLKTLWAGRLTILICLMIGTTLGIFVAILTPKQFTATTIMVPQMTSKSSSMGGLGGLAALAGIDLSGASQGSEMSPILYPKIVSSTPFQLELMKTPLKFSKYAKPISLYDYYTADTIPTFWGSVKKYSIGLPGVIISALKGKATELQTSTTERGALLTLTEKQNAVSKALDAIVSLEVEAKEGYLTLSVIMPEPLAAAQLARKAQELLQRDITNFKSQKAKAELEFIQERYNEAQAKAEGYQINIAQKTDQYKDLTSAIPQVQTTRIQTKYGIANSVFQELAKQLEQAKIQVKKDTPIFTVIEPVTVPLDKSKPNRPMILIIYIMIGGFVGLCLTLGNSILIGIRKKWYETNDLSVENSLV